MKIVAFWSGSIFQGSNKNKSTVAQIKAWDRTGDKPLSEPMMDQFADA